MVHGRGGGHGAGVEGLHLVSPETIALEPQGQVHHVFVAGAGVGRDEVGNEELLLAGFFAELVKQLLELVVRADARLHHLGQRALLGVLGRDFQVAADVVGHQFLDIGRRLHREIVAHAGGDHHLLHARQRTRFAVEADQRFVARVQVRANTGIDARRPPARAFDRGILARHPVHVRRRAADVADRALEVGRGGDAFQLGEDRALAAALDDAALVHRDAAERISDTLNEKGIYSTYYHGGMDQDERERALIQFRNGSVSYLITTDLAARGLDIPEMKHVIHYHLPLKEDEFTHRNGRTARMQASGTAYIVAHESEKKMEYLDYGMDVLKVDSATTLPKPPEFQTIYISGGKKNKLNKIDIVGFFSQKGKLEKGDLGLIEVKDFISFAAVKFNKVKDLLHAIKDEKMKGKKFKIEVARKVIKKEEE